MRVRRFRGSATEFHLRPVGDLDGVEVWSFAIERPAIVLGSRQSVDVLDLAACAVHGVEVVTRRSGGGVVLVEPGAVEWVDVVVPAHSPWWTDDVVAALSRCGNAWVEALTMIDPSIAATVFEGRLRRDPLSELICFAALGAGEVVVAGGRKLVGISQRRTRDTARLQCVVHRRWNPELLGDLLAPGAASRGDVESIAVATVDVTADELLAALDEAISAAVDESAASS